MFYTLFDLEVNVCFNHFKIKTTSSSFHNININININFKIHQKLSFDAEN